MLSGLSCSRSSLSWAMIRTKPLKPSWLSSDSCPSHYWSLHLNGISRRGKWSSTITKMPETRSFDVAGVPFGNGELSFLLGPCVVESGQHAMFMAQEISDICKHVGVRFVYKSSFDKANRSSIESFRGEGMEFGLEILTKVKAEIGVPVVTDIHEPWQAEKAAEVADILQIPAFL